MHGLLRWILDAGERRQVETKQSKEYVVHLWPKVGTLVSAFCKRLFVSFFFTVFMYGNGLLRRSFIREIATSDSFILYVFEPYLCSLPWMSFCLIVFVVLLLLLNGSMLSCGLLYSSMCAENGPYVMPRS